MGVTSGGQPGIEAHARNQLHRLLEDILGLELLELRHHIRIHTARNLCFFNQFVRGREIEMAFDSMAGSDQVGLVHVAGRLNRTVELLVHLGRQRIGKRIERIGELLDGVELLQLLANAQQLAVDLRYGYHVDIQLDTHLLTEDVDQLRMAGAAGPPAKYQMLVSTISAPLTMADSTEARP